MNHYTWTYVAGGGRNIPVGVYHSSKKGHLIIYVGKKITSIDFKVLDSKEYTFFIDNELCRIKLKRKGDQMYYYFEIDKKADTPMNRARWAMERKFLWQLVAALAVFALVVTGFVIFLNHQNRPKTTDIEKLLAAQASETIAKVIIEPGDQAPKISYHFVAQNQGFSSKPDNHNKPLVVSINGMPLESGDEFIVEYVPSNPSVNRIDFQRPTKQQVQVYQERVAIKHLALHPDEAPQIVKCKVQVAFDLGGIGGLADFYFQNTTKDKNSDHNELSYSRLTHSLPFQKKVKEDCWQ